jgi:hypothetical protein
VGEYAKNFKSHTKDTNKHKDGSNQQETVVPTSSGRLNKFVGRLWTEETEVVGEELMRRGLSIEPLLLGGEELFSRKSC